MNEQPDFQDPSVSLWQYRDELPRLPLPAGVLLMLACALLSGAFCLSGTGLLSTLLAGAVFAVLLLLFRHPAVLLTVPAAYACALLFWRDPAGSLSALTFVPPALVLAVCIYRRRKCSRTVLWLCLACGLTAAVWAAAALQIAYGSVLGGCRELLAATEKIFRDTITELAQQPDIPASLQEIYLSALTGLDDSLKELRFCLPGIFGCGLLIFSWLLCRLTHLLLRIRRADQVFFRKKWRVTVPLWWAIAYVAITLISVVASFLVGLTEIPYLICFNFLLIATPPVLAVGARRLTVGLRKMRRRGAMLPYMASVILLLLLFCCGGQFLLIAVPYTGAFYVIRRHRQKKTGQVPPPDSPPPRNPPAP